MHPPRCAATIPFVGDANKGVLGRKELLNELRRRHIREQATLTPGERIAKVDAMREFAHAVCPGARSPTDEPPELWLKLIAKWRGQR